MDKIPIPKLRRKPKPPAIETSIERNAPTDHTKLAPDDGADGKLAKSPKFASRMSPFRRLRGGKRARSCSPAAAQLGEPAAAVISNGAKPINGQESHEEPRLKIPVFLTQSDYELQVRFQEVQLDEQDRMQMDQRPNSGHPAKWTLYRQTNAHERGQMDRYANIKPWSHNRVTLNVPEGELDYVNASPVGVPASSEEITKYKYIAMQGPTEPSFDYVWRMIAEQTTSTAVIVQLTTMFEGDMRKCGQYFPHTQQEKTWTLNERNVWNDGWKATLTYDSLDELCEGAIERRKLLLHVEGEDAPRTIWHFLYLRWPDFGVPALTDIGSFFELMRLSREHADLNEPRIIHCSAGVGRTGTFICLEHLMRELELGTFDTVDPNDTDVDLVYDAVDTLRQQRRFMVQSIAQFMFVYQVMRKLWGEKYGQADEEMRGPGQQPALKRLEMASSPAEESASNSSFVSDGGGSDGEMQG